LKRGEIVLRGKKTSEADIIKIFVSFSRTGSYLETANEMRMPVNTVKGIIIGNKTKPKFAKLLDENKREFAEIAEDIVSKTTKLLGRRLDRALNRESELDLLIDEIADTDDEELDEKKKTALIKKLEALKIISPGELARTMGIYYDKMRIAKGESTENVNIQIGLSDD